MYLPMRNAIITTLALVVLSGTIPTAKSLSPEIYVDNLNGSALASGAPEAIGPIGATTTCHTNGSASTTIQWPSNGLSGAGVPTDGTAILWLNTPSGRQFSRITGLAANTVTVGNSFNIAMASAVDCAVGGRRLVLSQQLGLDVENSSTNFWQIHLVNSGIQYILSAPFVINTAGQLIGEKDGGVRPTIVCNFQPGNCVQFTSRGAIQSVEIQNSNSTKTGTVGLFCNDGIKAADLIIGGNDMASSFAIGVDGTGAAGGQFLVASLVHNNVTGMNANGIDFTWLVSGNVFRGNTTGLLTDGDTQNAFLVINNIFWENETGIELGNNDYNYYNAILFNTFDSNSTAAVSITDAGGVHSLLFSSNLITSNSVGVSYTGAARDIQREAAQVDFNCYGQGATANGANVSGFVLGPNEINVDPRYVDAATGDFTPLNSDAAFIAWPPGLEGLTPRFFPGTATASEPRCGAIQPATGGGFSNVGI